MAAEDRKLTQGTAISSANIPGSKLYGAPAGGSPPWGYMLGSDLMGNLLSGGTVYPLGSISDGQVLQRSGGTVLGVDVMLNPSAWTGKFYAQDAAPSSPVADDLWWETDTGILWTYGTYAGASRWVSANLYMANILSSGAAALATAQVLSSPPQLFGQGYDLYIDKLYNRAHVLVTNDANNYWKFDLRKISGSTVPASGAGTLLGTMNTSAQSPGAWFDISVSIDAVIDGTGAGIEFPILETSKAGATGLPGSIWEAVGLTFRLVHP